MGCACCEDDCACCDPLPSFDLRGGVKPPAPGCCSGAVPQAPVRAEPKIARNAPCPCGSGKKFKRCCAQ